MLPILQLYHGTAERVKLYGKQARQPVVQATKKGRTGQYPRTRYLLRRGWRAVRDKADKAAVPGVSFQCAISNTIDK